MRERLQKLISASGTASRREAERLILAGRVFVNGEPAELGQSADLETDTVEVDGKPLQGDVRKVYIMLHKPRGVVTTMDDEKGRRTVADLVKDCPVRVYPVGRLDMDSSGLLLMTNDGELTNTLTHPSHEKTKIYRLRVEGDLTDVERRLAEPMTLDGYRIQPAAVRLLNRKDEKAVLSVAIHEGRNRQIRRMCEQLGLRVAELVRVEEAGVRLGELKSGTWRYLSEREISSLKSKMQD